MKYVISNYNNDLSWITQYTSDYVIYNQGEPIADKNAIQVEHIGTDIYDKLSFIIDNYHNLPEVVCMVKGNFLTRFITPEEFEKIKDNQVFTPILTQHHKVYEPICRYKDGLYEEINNYWYLSSHPANYPREIIQLFNMDKREYNQFAPGSSYILPKENILQHPKSLYEELRKYVAWAVYPGDAQLLERNLYYLWKL